MAPTSTLPWRADFATTGAAAPAFGSIRARAVHFASSPAWPGLDALCALAHDQGLVNARGLPIRFVAQASRCGQLDYEAGILASGDVPTRRDNWHDLLNALVWLAFPHTKAALNQVQCATLPGARPGRRPALADAATLFDESGLLLVSANETPFQGLRQRRWRDALWTHRDDWRGVRVYAIGHALLEKALTPYPGITAKCLALALPARDMARLPASGPIPPWLDQVVASVWSQGRIARPADLFPLPILGIPGWWPDNEQMAFYDQTDIFRPPAAAPAPTRQSCP